MTQTETRIFHYDLKGHLIAETNQTGQMLAEYVYLGDQLLAMIKPGESVYYFHNDHLGTPQVLTDDSQAIVWKAVYTPFGDGVASIQTVENPFRFPGQYYDQETGLHYNYFRYYNPQTGRYITPDPIGLEGGINLFAYTNGNPIRWTDTWGLRSLTQGEITILKTVYNNTIDYEKVDVRSGASLDPRTWPPIAFGYAVTLGNKIYFRADDYKEDFSKEDLSYQAFLVHETGHVYQYQNDPNYSWVKAAIEGLRSDTYKYKLTPCKSFSDYRYEQQAQILADYYKAVVLGSEERSIFELILGPKGLGATAIVPIK